MADPSAINQTSSIIDIRNLGTIFTAITAFFAACIAYLNYKMAQNKFKLDLFTRRLAIYDTARDLLASIMTSPPVTEDKLFIFLCGIKEAKWLLNDHIADYLEKEYYYKACKLNLLYTKLDDPANNEKINTRNEINKYREWFSNHYKILDDLFSDFLKIKH
jgi:hypothetical protein